MITAVRFVCLMMLLSVFSFRVAAEDFTNAIHAYLQQCIDSRKINGCTVIGIVDEHGSSVISYGKLDNGTGQDATGDTAFALCSATGTFTRLLLQDMVDRGELKLDDPAAKYLPESVRLPTRNGKEITLRHLAMEKSGLPIFNDKFDIKRVADGALTVENMDVLVSASQLIADPGTKRYHGGVDLGLLSQAMAFTTGTNYESLMADRVFRPLKMDGTLFTLTPELKSRLAGDHDGSGFDYRIPSFDYGALKPLAGLYSTANDLLKFASANLGLSSSSLAPLMEKMASNFPLVPQGGGVVHTGGGDLAGGSYVGFDKARRRAVVVLSTAYVVRRDLGYYLLKSEWQSDHRPIATNISYQIYDSYVGQYNPKAAGASPSSIGIRRDGDRLFAQASGAIASPPDELLPEVAGELLPESETVFFERLSGRPVTFLRNGQGKVTGFTIDYQGRMFSYEKISGHPPKAPEPVNRLIAIKLDPKLLDACAGRYKFAPGTVVPNEMELTIRREEDKLVGQGLAWQGMVLKGDFDIYPKSETEFFDEVVSAQYTFVKNRKGEVTAVVRHVAGLPDCEGKRVNY